MKTNEQIVQLVAGELNAFEMVFRNEYRPLVQYGYSFLRDSDDAEDVVQQVFVNLWEKREELDIQSSLRAFLYRAVHNACLNRIRHRKIRKTHAEQTNLEVETLTPVTAVQLKELEQRIEAAISELPEHCQRIFRLSRFEELKYQEIADRLGISVKTVENQMGKALKVLRESLKDSIHLFILFLLQSL